MDNENILECLLNIR